MNTLRIFGRAMCALALAINQIPSHANADEEPSVKGPVVREPVKPKSSDVPMQGLPQAPKWKPGDPVRVMPDLKSSTKPKVGEPVKPKVKEGSLKDEPVIQPAPPDAPVRVMPDLRETPAPPAPAPRKDDERQGKTETQEERPP